MSLSYLSQSLVRHSRRTDSVTGYVRVKRRSIGCIVLVVGVSKRSALIPTGVLQAMAKSWSVVGRPPAGSIVGT